MLLNVVFIVNVLVASIVGCGYFEFEQQASIIAMLIFKPPTGKVCYWKRCISLMYRLPAMKIVDILKLL